MAVLSSMLALSAPRPPRRGGSTAQSRRAILLRRASQYLERRPDCRGLVLGAAPHALAAELRSCGLERLELGTEPVHLGRWPGRLPGLSRAPGPASVPLLVLGEGLAETLEPTQLWAWLASLGAGAPPGSRILLDVPSAAAMRWAGLRDHGLRQIAWLTAPHPRLRLDAVHPITERSGLLPVLLGTAFRIANGLPWRAVYELGVDA
jgi:hypothetical protein